MDKLAKWALLLAALIAISTAVAHLSCIILGPDCFKAQMAPEPLVQSAIDGTWLAPISTIVVSLIFVVCGLFALSAAKIIRKLPLLNTALITIASICIVRGIATVPLSFLFPQMVSVFSLLAGAIWFITGLLFAFGFYYVYRIDSL